VESSRRDGWEDDFEVYTASQVEGVLEFCEVEVVGDTSTHFLAYCPFHGNTDSPALAVDKSKGLWTCFNPSCMTSGTLRDMLMKRKKLNHFQSQRTINKYANEHATPFADRLAEAMSKPPDFVEFPQDVLTKMKQDFPGSIGEQYMKSRGFTDDTLDFFDVGYSVKKNMVIVPMHDPKGMPIGLIGRTASHDDKRFKNSLNLPKSKTAWNIHRAKTHGDTVIVCEASYDAMRIHQAGYPNVVALLGGHVTSYHLTQLGRFFSKVIIMTDFDQKIYRPNCRMCNYNTCTGHRPGRDLGRSIVKGMPKKRVLWAAYDDKCVFPHGAKDAGDMTDDEIRHCLRNAVSNLEYSQWNVEDKDAEKVAP
jgi:5S rRNA maturation endonuclease (ribonuclease M5)